MRRKVQALVCVEGQKLGRADAEFVKASTGFSIGGVSPVGHAVTPVTLIDRDLLRFDEIWAAAGHPAWRVQAAPGRSGAPDGCAGGGRCRRGVTVTLNPKAMKFIAATAACIRASDQNYAQTVPSPCMSVCQMDEATGLCQGLSAHPGRNCAVGQCRCRSQAQRLATLSRA